jgi:predicted dehydrogenase
MLRLGIIGAGHFAKAHVAALSELGERVRLVAAARRDCGQGFAEAEAMGARLMSAEELIAWDEVDAVSVCVPNHLHRRYAEAALSAGKQVFCEKPLAMTLEDADALIEAVKQSGAVLMVGHVTRHTPLYMAVAEIVSSGRVGAVRTVYANRMHSSEGRWWRMNPDIGGGVVFDLLVHDFDLMGWLMGRPKSVVARGHKHVQGAYDQMAALFTYADGRTALVEGGLYLRPPCGVRSTLRVVCERGHIEVMTPSSSSPIHVFEEGCEDSWFSVPTADQRTRALIGEYTEFLDAIEGRVLGRLRLEDARQAVACAVTVVRAADSGQETHFE